MERIRGMTGMPRRRKGIILLMTLFFMVLFYMLAFGIYTQSQRGSGNGEGRTSLRDKTVTEASFACGAGIRYAKEWVSAVTKPATGNDTNIEDLGRTWANNTTTTIGSHSYQHVADDLFSVPGDDPNFELRALKDLACPNGRFSGKLGADFLGFKADMNLTGVDYTGMKNDEANWPVFKSKTALQIGQYEVYSYLVPSTKAIASNSGASGDSLKTFLCIAIAYRDGLPVLRSRVLLKEVSSAKFAYRSNKNGSVGGRPVSWTVENADTVLFDGPVHTNDIPVMSIPSTYWDDAATFLADGRAKRAFMGGGLTFSASNTLGLTLSPGYDGVGYADGNILGKNDAKYRPYDKDGAPIASSAGGGLTTRYDRMIEGGREAIRKIPNVPLPSELLPLKAGAFGKDTVTGLHTDDPDPSKWEVDPTQKNGSAQGPASRAGYTDSSGTWHDGESHDPTLAKDSGIFVNKVSGTNKAAGGIAIKGDTRNMYLEVTDGSGHLVTDNLNNAFPTSPAPTNSSNTRGNPTVRIQSTIDSYDSNTGKPIPAYTLHTDGGTWVATVPGTFINTVAGNWVATVPGTWIATVPGTYTDTVPGTYTATVPGTWVATVPGTWTATVPGTWVATVPGTWTATVPGTWVATVPGTFVATVPGTYIPEHWVIPTGAGAAGGYTVAGAWSPATKNGFWSVNTVNGKWSPATKNGFSSGYANGKWSPATKNGFSSGYANGKWSPATKNGFWSTPTKNAGTYGYAAGKWSPATKNGFTNGAASGKWSPATKNGYTVGGGTSYTTAGVDPVLDPVVYKAQDWVVDVKNVDLVIPVSMPLPSGMEAKQWQTGYKANIAADSDAADLTIPTNALQAGLVGKVPTGAKTVMPDGTIVDATPGITEVYYHANGDEAGVKLTAGSPERNVPKGKIAVFKQSRSDANRLDVFIIDNPNPPAAAKAGLNGAIYATGNISGLRGINMDAKTIGVDFSSDKKISIMDSITQVGTPPGSKTPNGYHGLGIVGTAINVQTLESNFADKKLYIYATMIAGKSTNGNLGGMDVSHSNNDNAADFSLIADSTDTNATGRNLWIFGGLTEQETKARLLGSAGGTMGWNQTFNFDKQLSFLPPPFFPSTNLLAPLAYFQEVVIGQ